jgi:hypothetical protein
MSRRPARSEYGYTDRIALSLLGEPEAVDEREQSRQTIAARRKAEREAREQERLAWSGVRPRILDGVVVVHSLARRHTKLASAARAIRREVDRIDAELRP